jgi:poly-beta-1,6-N-acetyl-D-glucosamine synthase
MALLATVFYFGLMLVVFAGVWWDRRERRPIPREAPLTVLIPCFNDGATVRATVASVFASWPQAQLEVIVVNDASTDGSGEEIDTLATEYPIRVVHHRENQGKAAGLNAAMAEAQHEFVLILDADTELNPVALADLLARFAADPNVGAVSCPYRPSNRGLLPAMQAIEYNMLRLVQGASNVFSGLALWGGCLLTRRSVFRAIGGFLPGAITEDVDLAFRLNQAGWRVQQSFCFVRSLVPDRWRAWARQKQRWTGGGFQCVFRYPGVWLRHPLQPLFGLSYLLLIAAGVTAQVTDRSLFDVASRAFELWDWGVSVSAIGTIIELSYGELLIERALSTVSFYLLSIVFVLPLLGGVREGLKLLLVVPFAMAYYPAYSLVAVGGLVFWFCVLRRLPMDQRAW